MKVRTVDFAFVFSYEWSIADEEPTCSKSFQRFHILLIQIFYPKIRFTALFILLTFSFSAWATVKIPFQHLNEKTHLTITFTIIVLKCNHNHQGRQDKTRQIWFKTPFKTHFVLCCFVCAVCACAFVFVLVKNKTKQNNLSFTFQ